MSNYQQRDYTGSLFKNEEKKTESHPDYSGTALVGGVEMFMDAWIKTADSGRKWMSFSFKPKEKQSAPQRASSAPPPPRTHGDRPGGPKNRPAPQPSTGFGDMDDDIPF